MRFAALILFSFTAACSNDGTSPVLGPFQTMGAGLQNQINNENRGAVEVFVKTNHPALISDIRRGGGPVLTQAFDLAEVPVPVRAPHTLRLQSDLALYNANPGALVVAIMAVAG